MLEVTKCAPEQAISDLGAAFSSFFKKKSCYPRFKKKGFTASYYLANDRFTVYSNKIKISRIGLVRAAEPLRFTGKIINGTISCDVDRWYISIAVEIDNNPQRFENRGVVGVDLGVKTLATLSDGTTFENPKFYYKALKRIKKLSKDLARKRRGSNNRVKAKLKLAKLHRRIRLARKTNLHNLSSYVCHYYNTVVIEDLNVSGMVKNHSLACAISDCGFGLFRNMLTTKAVQAGTTILVADRFYPSSKTCSKCGCVKQSLSLSERTFRCTCGFELDRDLNAALNLKKLGAGGSEVTPVESATR